MMAIKRKDGSVYKLQGPNPLMQDQSFWDGEKSVVHNFSFKEIVTSDDNLEDVPCEEINVAIKEVDPATINLKNRTPQPIPRETVHCLLTQIKETHDPLYNETRSSLVFGGKTTLEIIVISRGDLQFSFWNQTTDINRGSIIYVPKDRRWWRVAKTAKENDGFTCMCSPSDLQPSFD